MSGLSPAEWYVAFSDRGRGEARRWWHLFTRAGFGHCCAFGYVRATKVWVLVDWTAEGLAVLTLRDETADALIVESVNRGRVLAVRQGGDFPAHGLRLPVLYCVPMVKHLVGLRSRAVTPWQLFCELRRRGCPEMFASVRQARSEAAREAEKAEA